MEGWIGLYKTEGSSALFLGLSQVVQYILRKAKVDKQTQNTSAKRKTMNFSGCHALVMLLLFCFVILVLGSPAEGQDNPLFELSSRDEVVQMAGYGERKLSTVLVTGSVNCEARFHSGDQPHAWPIPGAWVAVNCHSHASERKGKSMVARGVTDEFGDFMVDLPSHLHAIPNLEKICTVKVHWIPKGSLCRPVHVKKHMRLRLSSFGNGIRTYSAGNIRIEHSTSKPLHAARSTRGRGKGVERK